MMFQQYNGTLADIRGLVSFFFSTNVRIYRLSRYNLSLSLDEEQCLGYQSPCPRNGRRKGFLM